MDETEIRFKLQPTADPERLYHIRRRMRHLAACRFAAFDPDQLIEDVVYLLGLVYPDPDTCPICGGLIMPSITRLINNETCRKCHRPARQAILRPAVIHQNPHLKRGADDGSD